MKPLTDRQREILDFIVEEQRQGLTPTLSEIAMACGNVNVNSVLQILLALQTKGYVALTRKRSRSIRVIDTGTAETLWGRFAV